MSGKVERRVPLPAYVTVDGAKYYPEGTIESLEAERDQYRESLRRVRADLVNAELEAERDELRASVERAKAIIVEYVGSPCFSALLGEYDEDRGCGCPTCGHRAAFLALNQVAVATLEHEAELRGAQPTEGENGHE